MNTGRAPEIVGSLSFLEFWQFKRFILDCNWRDDVEGENRNQTAFQYKAISQDELWLTKYQEERVALYNQLLDIGDKYKHVNQYE